MLTKKNVTLPPLNGTFCAYLNWKMLSVMKEKSLILIALAVTMLFIIVGIPVKVMGQNSIEIINHLQEVESGKGIITIRQDPKIEQLLNSYYLQNAARPGMQGYRIRIFYDPGQQSRANSLEVMTSFLENYPGVPIYRTFDSPYYKVSVGDFRTRDEALKELNKLIQKYPKAFIIPEWINFPRVD
jgi:hypothetical protein